MITESMMYWITRLDYINTAASATFGISIAVLLFLMTSYVVVEDDLPDEILKIRKPVMRLSVLAVAISALVSLFVPSTKEMAMIYAVPAISRSDVLTKDIPDLWDLGMDALKEKISGKIKENI